MHELNYHTFFAIFTIRLIVAIEMKIFLGVRYRNLTQSLANLDSIIMLDYGTCQISARLDFGEHR